MRRVTRGVEKTLGRRSVFVGFGEREGGGIDLLGGHDCGLLEGKVGKVDLMEECVVWFGRLAGLTGTCSRPVKFIL